MGPIKKLPGYVTSERKLIGESNFAKLLRQSNCSVLILSCIPESEEATTEVALREAEKPKERGVYVPWPQKVNKFYHWTEKLPTY